MQSQALIQKTQEQESEKTDRPFAKSEVMQQLLLMMQKITAEPNNDANPDNYIEKDTANDKSGVVPGRDGTDNNFSAEENLSDQTSQITEASEPAEKPLTHEESLAAEGDLPAKESQPAGAAFTDEVTSGADKTHLAVLSQPDNESLPAEAIDETSLIPEESDSTHTGIEEVQPANAEIAINESDVVIVQPSSDSAVPHAKEGFIKRWYKRAVSWVKKLVGY